MRVAIETDQRVQSFPWSVLAGQPFMINRS